MTYDFGDIVLVDFPFSSNLGIKKRPAVVISNENFNSKRDDLILLAITSRVDNLKYCEKLIDNWKSAGLLKASAFKSVVFTVEKNSIYKTMGKLIPADQSSLINLLKQIIK